MTSGSHKRNMETNTSTETHMANKKRCPFRASQIRRRFLDRSRRRSSSDSEVESLNPNHGTAFNQEAAVRKQTGSHSHMSARSDRPINGTTRSQRTNDLGGDQYNSPYYTHRANTPVSVQPFEAVATGIGEHMRDCEESVTSFFGSPAPALGYRRASILRWQLEMEHRPFIPGRLSSFRRHTH